MFLLHGYLNHGNYGDELLAEIVERRLQKHYPEAKFNRLSSKDSFLDHFKLIEDSEYFICLGGLFQDKTSLFTPFYYFLTTYLAYMKGMKILFLAQGVGPLEHPLSKWFCKKALALADFVSVRDKTSSDTLKELAIDHFYGADLAWSLYNNTSLVQNDNNYGIDLGIKSKIDAHFASLKGKTTVLSLKSENYSYSNEYLEKFLTKLIEDCIQDISKPIIILEMQDSDTYIHSTALELIKKHRMANNILDSIQDIYIKANEFKSNELLYCLNKYGSEITSMRLHALIVGHIAGLKSTAIAVDQKINDFIHQIDIYNLETLKDRAEKHYDKVLFLNF